MNPNPDLKTLRKFGFIMGLAIGVGFGLFFPYIFSFSYFRPLPLLIAGLFFIFSWWTPSLLLPIFHIWNKLSFGIREGVNRIIIGTIFYLLVLPLGKMMCFLGQGPISKNFNSNKVSYREPPRKKHPNYFYKPF